MYPSNSREVSFLTTADCRETFARLVRELDRLDEEGVFGPCGWRDRLTGPAPSRRSLSAEYREQLALGDRLAAKPPDFGSGNEGSSPSPSATCVNCRTFGFTELATVVQRRTAVVHLVRQPSPVGERVG